MHVGIDNWIFVVNKQFDLLWEWFYATIFFFTYVTKTLYIGKNMYMY